MMIKTKRKIAYVALWLCITPTPPLQATQSSSGKPDTDTHHYAHNYLVKALALPDIGHIVIGYISPQEQYFINLLDLMIILAYHEYAQQMIGKAEKETLLLISAQRGHFTCVKYLHQQGADINTKDQWGNTALIWSVLLCQLDCVKYLVAQGTDIEVKNNDGDTALTWRDDHPLSTPARRKIS